MMHLSRLFGVSVLLPLIAVGLCAKSEHQATPRNAGTRHISQVQVAKDGSNSTTKSSPPPTIHFPQLTPEIINASLISPRLTTDFSRPVSNSTSAFEERSNFVGEGRGVAVWELINLSWLVALLWKAVSSYAIVTIVNVLATPFLKKFGWGGPYWDFGINLGNSDGILSGPSLKHFKLAFGGSHGKDDMKEDDDDHGHKHQGYGHGWPNSYGHGQPGHVGFNPNHVGPGWLSYDQAALAMPAVDKYSIKAAKKAQKYTKKAQKYAHKASKYAAKAQAAKLAIKPLYANGFIHPGAATVPGIPSYGWGRR